MDDAFDDFRVLLGTALNQLGLIAQSVEELFPQPPAPGSKSDESAAPESGAGYCLFSTGPGMLLACGHFEFSADGIIHHPCGGTLGIIHFVPSPAKMARAPDDDSVLPLLPGQAAAGDLRDKLEQAAYLRHLLLQEPGNDRPAFVEVTLILQDWEATAVMAGEVLRHIMDSSSILHTIGVGLLDARRMDDPAAVRRAFPWVLSAVEKWYQDAGTQNTPESGGGRLPELTALILRDFRRPGLRKWTFQEGETLHVVHGQNGSGKSTLSEALELVVTGRIQRLENGLLPVGGYPEVLRYRSHEPGRGALNPDNDVFNPGDDAFNSEYDAPGSDKDAQDTDDDAFGSDDDAFGSDDDVFNSGDDVPHIIDVAPGMDDDASSTLKDAPDISGRAPDTICHAQDIPRVLTGPGNGKLEIRVQLAGEPEERIFPVGEKGSAQPLSRMLPADAFRLDETLSVRISRGTPAERAGIFLKALLGQEGQRARDRAVAERTAASLREKLPRAAREAGDRDRPAAATPLEARLAVLGSRIPVLAGFFPDSFRLAPEVDWSDLQPQWKALLSHSLHRHRTWMEALEFLGRLAEWEAGKQESATERPPRQEAGPLLREFEELTAMVDLLEREVAVTATLARARTEFDWEPPERLFCGIRERTPDRVRHQREYLADAKQRLEQCQAQLEVFDSEDGGNLSGGKLRLPDGVVPVLDEIGLFFGLSWERIDWQGLGLGEGVRRILAENSPCVIRGRDFTITIGKGRELHRLMERLRSTVEALADLALRADDYPGNLEEFGKQIEALEQAEAILRRLEGQTVQAFNDKIRGPLAAALNELTALMTPARWAYGDITATVDLSGNEEKVELNAGKIPAALTLNTAELNTMTLALFLLCGIQQENPLRLIVLDDPLQNMDELSVTTVARGLARLFRLWDKQRPGHGWRVVLLLHGEENVERIRAETPCAAYFLPWLTPGLPAAQTPKEVVSESSRLGPVIVPLAKTIQPVSASAG